jgi:hypothetical protein
MDKKARMVSNSKEPMVFGHGGLPFNREKEFIKPLGKGARSKQQLFLSFFFLQVESFKNNYYYTVVGVQL